MAAERNFRKTTSEPWKSEPYRMRVIFELRKRLPSFMKIALRSQPEGHRDHTKIWKALRRF
jgi:hypothetical protein